MEKRMVRNIIFDMGNVLMYFDKEKLLFPYLKDENDRKLVIKEVFDSGDWARMDWGEYREEDLADLVCPRLPIHLQEPVRLALVNWYRNIELIPENCQLVQKLKDKGCRVYLLSNAGFSLEDVYRHDIPAIGIMDGRMISALEGVIKPHDEIYQRLLSKFNLKAEECFFIDDMEENIEGAMRNGIQGYVFDGDCDALRDAVEAFIGDVVF